LVKSRGSFATEFTEATEERGKDAEIAVLCALCGLCGDAVVLMVTGIVILEFHHKP